MLPLANLSGDPEQESFADGMTETLIAELAKPPACASSRATSVMQFKGAKTTLPEIAKTLNVDGVIEGSVMRAGNQVRITAQLIDARADRHLWAQQYDRELARVLEIQSEVARAVAARIQLALTPEQSARLKAPKPVDPRAQDAYFRGLAARHTWDVADLANASRKFEEAIRVQPDYALAHASQSSTLDFWSLNTPGDIDGRRLRIAAKRAAIRAVELDPAFRTVFWYRALAHERLRQFDAALHDLEQLYGGDESSALHLAALADALRRGAIDDYWRNVARWRSPLGGYEAGRAYCQAGDIEAAFAELERAFKDEGGLLYMLDVDPSFDPLRRDPRFADLARRINLPPTPN